VKPGSHRYRTLEHWRGVAALAVLLFHAFEPLQREIAQTWLQHTIGYGWLGVPLFFVISGYCIAERLSQEYPDGGAGRFLLDRACRLLPPYWAALVLTATLRFAALPFNGYQGAPTWDVWLPAPLLLEKVFGREHALLVAWSLAYEFAFYLAAAGLLLVAQRVRSMPAAIVAASLLPLTTLLPGGETWRGLTWGGLQFLAGGLVWLVLRPSAPSRGRAAAIVLLLTGAALAFRASQLATALAGVFATTLVLAARWDDALANARALRPLAWVGAMSYSLYLIHLPLVGPVRNLLGRVWPHTPVSLIALALIAAAVGLAGAMVFHRLVEAPLERRRRAIFGRRPTRAPSPPA
jgi:exopolysaccharide production protein ExoZ